MGVPRAPLVLSLTIATVVVSFIFIAFGFSASTDVGHQKHQGIVPTDFSNIEHRGEIIRAGDAQIVPDFSINRDFVDPDDNCDFCTQVNYSSAIGGEAAIAYQIDNVDMSNSKRLVFFAKGEKGGEQITILGAGKFVTGSSPFEKKLVRSDLFPDSAFGFETQQITLTKHWKRFVVDLRDRDLKEVDYPFGLIIRSNPYSEARVFYIKGVTFDEKEPAGPGLISSST